MKRLCLDCYGSGLDRHHRWFDGVQPACEACGGYGEVDEPLYPPATEDARLDDPKRGQSAWINKTR